MAAPIINGSSHTDEAQSNENGPPNHEECDGLVDPMCRPKRDDEPFETDIFPDTDDGRLLKGLLRSYLIKQEPRMGWARKGACDDKQLLRHPCESVAAHQWGICCLITAISKSANFRREMPNFDYASAYEMATFHDLAELVTGDITPVDGITSAEKHRLESKAMASILSYYPDDVGKGLNSVYNRYEQRECSESKFVKDCDKLDFMLTAFMLERQGFRNFDEFYSNSNRDFFTDIAQRLANIMIATRDELIKTNSL